MALIIEVVGRVDLGFSNSLRFSSLISAGAISFRFRIFFLNGFRRRRTPALRHLAAELRNALAARGQLPSRRLV